MNATLWVSLVLGLGGALGTLFTVWTKIRDRRQEKAKAEGEIKLDQASYEEIAARAAKINSEERIEQERWWAEQFELVKRENRGIRKELDIERRFRRRITRYVRNHLPWDELAEAKLAAANIDIPPRPLLDIEDWDDNGDGEGEEET